MISGPPADLIRNYVANFSNNDISNAFANYKLAEFITLLKFKEIISLC